MFIRFDVIHERDGQTLHDSKDRAYASHRAVKIVLQRFNIVSKDLARKPLFPVTLTKGES